MKMSLVLLIAFLSVAQARAVSFYRTNDSLSEAHAAFLAGDSLKVATSLRETLLANPHDPVVKKNALQLYKQASLAAGQEGLAADWKLPSEITKMKIAVRRIQGERTRYQLGISGDVAGKGLIQQIQLMHYPDQVIMDKEKSIGRYREADSKDSNVNYHFYSVKTNDPNPTGLYLLKIVMASGKTVDGWFIVDEDMNSTAAPRVQTPAMDQAFSNGKPTLRWTNFQSPEYKPNEVRGLWIGISRVDLGEEWVQRWTKWVRSPSIEEVTVGVTSTESGVSELESGEYNLEVSYGESSNFGDIQLSRGSTVLRPFKVRNQ